MSDVVVEMRDPREHEAELKELFARNGKPGFAATFDRAYRTRAAQGMRSWVGYVDGQAIMHISVTPMRFGGAGQTRMGGVLGDLLVDENHRDFWAPVKLLRKMVADVKRGGEIEFLITTSTADAEPVFKAGGFKHLASLYRYVLPLFAPYLFLMRIRSRAARVKDSRIVAGLDRQVPPLEVGAAPFRPITDVAFYDGRVPREEYGDLTWMSFGHKPAVTVSRHPIDSQMSLVDSFWGNGINQMPRGLHAAARWGRRQGLRKFVASTLQESKAARELKRTGFVERERRSVLFIHQINKNPLPPLEDWFLVDFSLSSW